MNITVNGTTQPMPPDASLIALLAQVVGDCTDGVAVAAILKSSAAPSGHPFARGWRRGRNRPAKQGG